jgi:Zn-dependent protease with chaperone function
MASTASFRKDVSKVFLYALLSLFLIPLATWLFVRYAEPQRDETYLAAIEHSIEKDSRLSEQQKQENKAFFRANKPSSACDNNSAEFARYRAAVCGEYSELWQYHLARKISFWTLVGGVAVLLVVLGLGALAFVNRRSQYVSFVLGWNLLTAASAVEVVVQGAMLVWLSFWLTAFFFQVYFVKIIALVGIGAALAIFYAVVCIFKRAPQITGIAGETIAEQHSPALWKHIRDFAARIGTAPPEHLVAGIDTNFFVTESPLAVGERTLNGRALFVSLPLLRLLERSEADAVLAHELAHFRGGDTASSAALGPKLVQYEYYCQMMYAAKVTIFVCYLMRMYRVIFEFALRRDSRNREFLADKVAAGVVSARAIISSLIKISAYSRYRGEIERKLFEQNAQHQSSLGIAQRVASGLAPYATSAQFVDAMKTASIPHPFDSHPALPERMQNVAHRIEEKDYGAIVTSVPAQSWIADLPTAADIEGRLWGAYEQRFAAMHEQSLAYRYAPANEAERAVVLKYFPPQSFPLKGGNTFNVGYAGLSLPEQEEPMPWDDVADMKWHDGSFGTSDTLEIVHPEKGWLGNRTTKVKLPGIKDHKERLKAVLGHYWQRHKIATQEAQNVQAHST